MEFLKKLIESKEVAEPVVESVKVEMPDYGTEIGKFYVQFGSVYQDSRGAIQEISVVVRTPAGARYTVGLHLPEPVTDWHATPVEFNLESAWVDVAHSDGELDDELERILCSIAVKFANDYYEEAMNDALRAAEPDPRDHDPRDDDPDYV